MLPPDRWLHVAYRIPGLGVAHELDEGSHLVPPAGGQDGERDAAGIEIDGILHVPGRHGAALALSLVRSTVVPHVLVDDELVAAIEEAPRTGPGRRGPTTSTVPSSSTIGRRRRAAAMASPSWVCAFSRTRSSSRAACQVARSTTGGRPCDAVDGLSRGGGHGASVAVWFPAASSSPRRSTPYSIPQNERVDPALVRPPASPTTGLRPTARSRRQPVSRRPGAQPTPPVPRYLALASTGLSTSPV